MEGQKLMSNMWTNKTVAFQPLFNDSNRYLGFAVVDKELKYFYPHEINNFLHIQLLNHHFLKYI